MQHAQIKFVNQLISLVSAKTGHNVNESITELAKKVLCIRYPHLVKNESESENVSNTFGGKTIDLPKLSVEVETTTSTISLRWVPEAEETHFKVTLWEKDMSQNEAHTDTVLTGTGFTFKGLKFDTEYVVAITGFRKVILLGLETRSSGFMTIKTNKPEAPEGIRAADNGHDYVVLECEPSKYPSVVYQARYMKVGDGGFVNGKSSLGARIKIDGLDDGTAYLFQVRILSKLGRREGKWSDDIRVRTLNK